MCACMCSRHTHKTETYIKFGYILKLESLLISDSVSIVLERIIYNLVKCEKGKRGRKKRERK